MTGMRTLVLLALVLVAAACAADTAPSGTPPAESVSGVEARLDAIEAHVNDWQGADSLDEATAAAEAAANLVVGPNGPGYGDRNGDGTVGGESEAGLLPGVDGEPGGLVVAAYGDAACVQADVLGGPWDDPAARWAELDQAMAEWAPANNTFPFLASHPMRVVGWATLTVAADDLDTAREYAGHALLHVDVTRRALLGC
jgi:hypothetical protein